MPDEHPTPCLTQWLVDDQPWLATAQLSLALARIRCQLHPAMPDPLRAHLCAALLEFAVARLGAPGRAAPAPLPCLPTGRLP